MEHVAFIIIIPAWGCPCKAFFLLIESGPGSLYTDDEDL
jgi:hypothetical protein